MTEVLFYHLENRSLEQVLPGLLEISLQRGWRVVVQSGDPERLKPLGEWLWSYREDSFLPHGGPGDAQAHRHPVWLTGEDENPNEANVRFLVHGADLAQAQGLDRAVFLFNGRDEQEKARARKSYKAALDAGHDVTYWRQSSQGKWEKQN